MKQLILLIFVLIPLVTNAQNPLITKTIKKIDFKEDKDSVKAVFDWITDKIDYDVKMFKKISETGGFGNKKNVSQSKEEKIEYVLKSRKGVCMHYAELFDAIVKELGYQSFVVTGYTKKAEEDADDFAKVGHAWNAIKVKGKWKLIDPTWGAGGVRDNRKFVKKYKPEWYNVEPEEMIKTHIPYDPIWQLLELPIPYANFNIDLLLSPYEDNYNFESKIEAYLKKDKLEQTKEEIARSQDLGKGSVALERWLENRISFVKKTEAVKLHNKEVELRNKEVELHNKAVALLKNSSLVFNEYALAKRDSFADVKWTPEYCKTKLQKMQTDVNQAIEIFKSLKPKDSKKRASLSTSILNAQRMFKQLEREIALFENE